MFCPEKGLGQLFRQSFDDWQNAPLPQSESKVQAPVQYPPGIVAPVKQTPEPDGTRQSLFTVQAAPTLAEPLPVTQNPFEQNCVEVQATQALPLLPQNELAVPATHFPVKSQQPVG